MIQRGEGGLHLCGGRCAACGHVFYPFQELGCEACGAFGGALQAQRLSTEGAVVCFAMVRFSLREEFAAPYGVVEVKLDDGPIVRALSETASDFSSGERVVGTLIDETLTLEDAFRFRRAGAKA